MLYQKNGFVEHYGTLLRERRDGPIRINRTVLQVTHDEAWLMWQPDHSPITAGASMLEIEFAGPVP